MVIENSSKLAAERPTERKQDLSEAIKTYHSVKNAYAICGYKTIDVPKITVTERVNFILRTIEN